MKNYLKNKKVKMKFKEDIEPHEVFLDILARKKEEELGISEKKFELPISRRTLEVFYILFLISIFVFFAKTFELQILKGKFFSQLSKENKTRIEKILQNRGIIYDRNFEQLVWNQPSFDLLLDKRDLPRSEKEKEELFQKIAKIIKKDFNEIKNTIENSESSQVLLLENIPQETLISLKVSSILTENASLKIEENTVRNYIDGPTFSQIIGYTGKITKEDLRKLPDYSITDIIGKFGLEKFYENVLRGNPGKFEIERDVFGNLKSKKKIADPEDGKSLVLWLDSQLQKKITEELKLSLQRTGAKRGAAVAMNPKTGGILALVSLPSFDNNLFSQGKDPETVQKILNDPENPLINRVISGGYLTGSTIKPLIASAVLQEKIISPEKKIYDPGFIEVPNQYNPEIIYKYRDWKAHGWTDLRKAIAESCNVYFYTVGGGYGNQEGLGPTRIKKYLELFGWGQKTGIDLPGEIEGFIPDKEWKKRTLNENWWNGDTYYLSIGQQYLQITPLQVATAFSAIANGGVLYQPMIVQKIVDSEKNTILEMKPKIIRQNFIDQENLKIVREGMREAVTYGSSVILNNLPVKAASKTGTAETGKKDIYHSWVTVFAPYEDPEIVLTIVIENVPKVQMVAALPVAKNVLEWYFRK